VLGKIEDANGDQTTCTHFHRDRLPTSLRTLYHIARAYEINPRCVKWATNEVVSWATKHPAYGPVIHPDMSREDAEKLVEKAQQLKQQDETISLIANWWPTWHENLLRSWLAEGVSKQAIEKVVWEGLAVWNICERNQNQEYMEGLAILATACIKQFEADRSTEAYQSLTDSPENGFLGFVWDENRYPEEKQYWLHSALVVDKLTEPGGEALVGI
jgi:hypothetical protein